MATDIREKYPFSVRTERAMTGAGQAPLMPHPTPNKAAPQMSRLSTLAVLGGTLKQVLRNTGVVRFRMRENVMRLIETADAITNIRDMFQFWSTVRKWRIFVTLNRENGSYPGTKQCIDRLKRKRLFKRSDGVSISAF